MVDAAHEKETRARETIQSLKLEIANLSKLVEQGAGLTMGQDHRYNNSRARIFNFLLTCSHSFVVFCYINHHIFN